MDLIIEIADILCDTVVIYAKERHYCEIIRKKGLDNNIYPSIHVKQEDKNDKRRNQRLEIKRPV